MGGYLNLVTYGMMNNIWDDISARRLAGALSFAIIVAIATTLTASRFGLVPSIVAAAGLLFMPRPMGHAHVIGTDMPLMLFWVVTATSFWYGWNDRRWQWVFGISWAALFNVKFSGAVIGAPLLLSGLIPFIRLPGQIIRRYLWWTCVLALPVLPVAFTLLFSEQPPDQHGPFKELIVAVAVWGREHPSLLGSLLFWPLVVYSLFHATTRPSERTLPHWPVWLELSWIALAVTPLAAIALNPTWWHDTIPSLARYFDLNLHRRGRLPDINIFYLGKQYVYSLPWENAFVLSAVTVPFGTLLLALIGVARLLTGGLVPHRGFLVYALLHMLTLPFFRMAGTPAHDGVRLFLPTFFFLAVFAGAGTQSLLDMATSTSNRRFCSLMVIAVGPIWSAIDWARIHPFELSYYNVGLPRAVDWGFEPTYWYDAATLPFLEQCESVLPPKATVTVHLDPMINPEVFFQLQHLGWLRSDLELEPSPNEPFTWAWLLTHSSKATPFTRLVYAFEPVAEVQCEGVRLFSLVSPDAIATAWALHSLVVRPGRGPERGVATLREQVFNASPLQRHSVLDAIERQLAGYPSELNETNLTHETLRKEWVVNGNIDPNLALIVKQRPDAIKKALALLNERPEDIKKILQSPGYLRPVHFGGYFVL